MKPNQITYVPSERVQEILEQVAVIRPNNAQVVITQPQKMWLAISLGIILALMFVTQMTISWAITICVVGFTVQFALKSYLTVGSINSLVQITKEQLVAAHDVEWPMYTVLVPMRGEESVIHHLVESMAKMDYPKDKLQVILVLEENDPKTVEAAQRIQLPDNFEVLVLADAGPRTKPKACTVALDYVRGEYCVVFDAEDMPEPDQLKKVVLAYQAEGPNVWCIQAKLEYHNVKQNMLTRLFSGEYIAHFNLTLPALGSQDLLFPLGGTSNHFRTQMLLALGGWDPFNVTEDLDLGIVIKRHGGLIRLIDSVTWEEANSRPIGKGAWISQRSRWIKGHMQAWLVHMRNPWALYRELGLRNFIMFQLIVLGSPMSLMLGPIFLLLTCVYAFNRIIVLAISPEIGMAVEAGIEALFPSMVYYMSVVSFIMGNLGIMYYWMLGCMLRKQYGSIKYMFFAPFYWLMMSAAAWKAFGQLITKPHYWEKTSHGHGKKT